MGTGEEFVEVSVGSSEVYLKSATAMITARLIEGHFPPYEDVLPKDHDKRLQLPRESFLSALRRAALQRIRSTPSDTSKFQSRRA